MVWDILLPAIGASIPVGLYAWKKDTEIKERLETAYGDLIKRTDLKPAMIKHYKDEINSFRGGVRSLLKKREYRSTLNQILKELGNRTSSDLEVVTDLPQEVQVTAKQ